MNILVYYDTLAASLATETGASDSLLHVHAGMAILLIARVLTRRSLATPIPLAFVVAAAVANEIVDRIVQGVWILPDAYFDVLNTISWPLMLMIGLRMRNARVIGPRRGRRARLGR